MNAQLFAEKNRELFMPDGVEYIYNILNNIGYSDYTSAEAKTEGMEVIKALFELDLIEVFSYGNYHLKFSNERLSVDEVLAHLDKVWFIGADFSDFVSMPMFKFKDWYLRALKEAGLTDTTEWNNFVREEIGDLQKWIGENRP
ncbi:hypothetical protein [Robertkochia sediminum]|uniref:hypothetical protein n=1 Tax=Robertkochia sediminum TaxID=2785326 RepID=UPI0019328DB0|nr:hypothetical protein [Robertkochia sediminum]MBL7472915.1 hypothetical protein [Robertkochia sediminum]